MTMRSAIAALLLFAAGAIAQQTSETITVERMIVDVRVIDVNGKAIPNLGAEDFRVRVGGKTAKVLAAEWNDETGVEPAPVVTGDGAVADAPPAPPPGRTFVFFFQNDFGRANARVTGHMKVLGTIEQFIAHLQPDDRVAVFSFDSHLRFWLDLTRDKSQLRDAVSKTLAIAEPPLPPAVPEPSLARNLDRAAMHDAATPERALTLVANALAKLPGRKSLVFFSWGLGHKIRGGVSMEPDYAPLQQSLADARTSLYSIDMTQAGHELALGLRVAAEESGGFYASTAGYVPQVYERLAATLSGYYELEVVAPPNRRERDAVVVDLPKNPLAKVMNIASY